MIRVLAMLVCVLPLAAAPARPVVEVFPRRPVHFNLHYGLPDSIVDSDRRAFRHPGTDGFTEIRGQFSTRRFHDRERRIEAVFSGPELLLVAVTIGPPARWTQADVDLLLAEYGFRWRRLGSEIWISEEGVRAIHRDGVFHLVSPRLIGEMDAARFATR